MLKVFLFLQTLSFAYVEGVMMMKLWVSIVLWGLLLPKAGYGQSGLHLSHNPSLQLKPWTLWLSPTNIWLLCNEVQALGPLCRCRNVRNVRKRPSVLLLLWQCTARGFDFGLMTRWIQLGPYQTSHYSLFCSLGMFVFVLFRVDCILKSIWQYSL